MIEFTSTLSPAMRAEIIDALHAIEARESVRILFAIESGSRAWGFPSPDSDYDARFVYVRRPEWYLSIQKRRDVIELPIVGDLDINGWDIQKALGLLIKPNPVLLEWLSSPIRYTWNEAACEKLNIFAERVSHQEACTHHYSNLARNHWKQNIEGREAVKLKRYFYVLRPVMALRWLRLRAGARLPMNFQALMAGVDLPADIVVELESLLKRKAETKELGVAPRIALLDEFITQELDVVGRIAKTDRTDALDIYDDADQIFREILQEAWCAE